MGQLQESCNLKQAKKIKKEKLQKAYDLICEANKDMEDKGLENISNYIKNQKLT